MNDSVVPKRDLIVAAARKLFLEGGYSTTSMDAVAKEAGVSKNTVYAHFHNKESLFAGVMGGLCQQSCNTEMEVPMPAGTPEQILNAVGKKFLHVFLAPEILAAMRVVLAESTQFPELSKTFLEAGPKGAQQRLGGYFAEWNRQGLLTVDDPDILAAQFLGMIKGPYFLSLLFGIGEQPTEKEMNHSLSQAVEIFLIGLGYRVDAG